MKFYGKAPCGCCEVDFEFNNADSAQKAIAAVPLGMETVTDDAGNSAVIDTFYGLRPADEPERGLLYLAQAAGLVTKG